MDKPLETFRTRMHALLREMSAPTQALMERYDYENCPKNKSKPYYSVCTTVGHLAKELALRFDRITKDRHSIQKFIHDETYEHAFTARRNFANLKNNNFELALDDPEFEQINVIVDRMVAAARSTLKLMGGPDKPYALMLEYNSQVRRFEGDAYSKLCDGLIGKVPQKEFSIFYQTIGEKIAYWGPQSLKVPKPASELHDILLQRKTELEKMATEGGYPWTVEKNRNAFGIYTDILDEMIARCEQDMSRRSGKSQLTR